MSFLGVLGTIGKIAGGVVAGAATGGLGGAILGGVAGAVGGSGGGVKSAGALPTVGGVVARVPTFAPTGAALVAPAAAGAANGGVRVGIDYPLGACPVGYHLRRGRSLMHPFGGGCTRNRRMNVTNPRALRRSIRRLKGFEKLARRVLSITSPGPKKFRIRKGRSRR